MLYKCSHESVSYGSVSYSKPFKCITQDISHLILYHKTKYLHDQLSTKFGNDKAIINQLWPLKNTCSKQFSLFQHLDFTPQIRHLDVLFRYFVHDSIQLIYHGFCCSGELCSTQASYFISFAVVQFIETLASPTKITDDNC